VFDPVIHGPEGTKWPKKEKATILDVTWIVDDYNMLQRPASFIAKDKDEADEIDKKIKQKQARGESADLMAALGEVINDREERLRLRLEAVAKRKSRLLSCAEFFANTHLPDWASYEPLNDLEARPISCLTPRQTQWLQKSGLDLESIANWGQAKKILDTLGDRYKQNLATSKQCKFAVSLGMDEAKAWTMSFSDMSAWLDKNAPPPPHWSKFKK